MSQGHRKANTGVAQDRGLTSLTKDKGWYLLGSTLAALHLLNYLNYSTLRFLAPFPEIRAALVVSLGVGTILLNCPYIIKYHVRENYDVYVFVLYCFLSVIFSVDKYETLKYSAWLILSVYLALETGRRVRIPQQSATVLLGVVLPTTIVAAALFAVMGAQVEHTGRVFGALGTTHINSFVAMEYLLILGASAFLPPALKKRTWLMIGLSLLLVVWAIYMSIFGLTRSVWVCLLLAMLLFSWFSRISFWKKLLIMVCLSLLLISLGVLMGGYSRLIPHSVERRLELTKERYEYGEIDGRVRGAEWGLRAALARPWGYGYAHGEKAHNSYINILLDTGFVGLFLFLAVLGRSVWKVIKADGCFVPFFLIGAGPLAVHAFFETQNLPGQGSFYVIAIWLALTRSPVLLQAVQAQSCGKYGVSDSRKRQAPREGTPPCYRQPSETNSA